LLEILGKSLKEMRGKKLKLKVKKRRDEKIN
jgi:hypothetical protein